MLGHFLKELESHLREGQVRLVSVDTGQLEVRRLNERFPDYVYITPLGEQSAILYAVGMAQEGVKVVLYVENFFALLRMYEQLSGAARLSYQNLLVVCNNTALTNLHISNQHAGLYDLAILFGITEAVTYVPATKVDVAEVARCFLEYHRGGFVRIQDGLVDQSKMRTLTKGLKMHGDNDRVLIIAAGEVVNLAMQTLEEGGDAGKLLVVTEFPISSDAQALILDELKNQEQVFVLEEHMSFGGLGSVIDGLVSEMATPVSVVKITPDQDLTSSYSDRGRQMIKGGLSVEKLKDLLI